MLDEFIAGQRSLVDEYSAEGADASSEGILVKAQLGVASSIARNKNGAEERQEPAEICGCQQVQGAALPPGSYYRALLHPGALDIIVQQTRAANAHRECRGGCILGLDATQVLYDLCDASGRIGFLWSESLCVLAQQADIVVG
jgi:hypothetical protein